MRRSSLFALVVLALCSGGAGARGVLLTACDAGCTYANNQLQAALLDAEPGDEILLQGGHTYAGAFKLPAAKSRPANDASCYISVRTGVNAAGALLPESAFPAPDVRMTPIRT